MYFSVKLRGFKGFFILVWFGVGQVQKTELSSHFKTLKLSVAVGHGSLEGRLRGKKVRSRNSGVVR